MGKIIYNNREIKRIYNGTREVFNICQGDTQIWQNFNGVDLGLPSGTLWADRNVGAKTPYDYGGKYAWGVTSYIENESWENYICSDIECGTNNDPLVSEEAIYEYDGEWFGDISGKEYDATLKDANSDWRLPTSEEVDELLKYCSLEIVKDSGNNVIAIKYKRTVNNVEKSIILPFEPDEQHTSSDSNCTPSNANAKNGYYWTGTINSGNPKQAYSLVYKYLSSSSVRKCLTSRFRKLAIRPVKKNTNNDPTKNTTIKFIDPDTHNEIQSDESISMYKGESKSLYFEIYPEMSSVKRVHFTANNSKATVTDTGYITAVSAGNVTIRATLANGNYTECNVIINNAVSANKIVLKDREGNTFAETSANHTSIILNEWESIWVLPYLLNSNNTSEGIVNKKLKWQITSGEDKAFMVPLYDMAIYWENSIPKNYECHPVKIFGLSSGTTTIKITYTNNDNTTVIKYIDVTINTNANKHNSYTFVDLGNNYWATENIGATSEHPITYDPCGYYFSWGETAPKDNYQSANYSHRIGSSGMINLGEEIYNTSYDAAYINWQGHWHTPSYQEMSFLSSLNMARVKFPKVDINGDIVYDTNNNIVYKMYYLIMGLNNDNYILIPTNGYKTKNTDNIITPTEGFYWTSTSSYVGTGNPTTINKISYELDIAFGFRTSVKAKRDASAGLSIRPVYLFEGPYISYLNSSTSNGTTTYNYSISYESGLTAYYTTDGSDPRNSATRYTYSNENISINENNINIRCITYNYNNDNDEGIYSEESASQYIDLGLPSGIKWCTHNLGANTFDEVGDFYSVNIGSSVSLNNNIINVNNTIARNSKSFYNNSSCDPATVIFGSNYCTPTFEDFEELVENCSFIYTRLKINNNNVNVYKVIGPNGNHIYLPFGTIKTSTNTTGESTTEIALMISNYLNVNTDNKLTNGYVKFIKTYKSSNGDGNKTIHNLNSLQSVLSNDNSLHIRPIYIGNDNKNGNRNIRNINNYSSIPISENDNENNNENNNQVGSLNDIINNNWSGLYPSAINSPKYKFNSGTHYSVAGCEALSSCQLMWHHKWPVVRKLSSTTTGQYSWNGDIIDATGKKNPFTYHSKTKNYVNYAWKEYHYNNIVERYNTSPYQSTAGLATYTSTIETIYNTKRIGTQYSYTEAVELANFLLEFGQLVPLRYNPYETVGNANAHFKEIPKDYQYGKKQFSIGRTVFTKEIFKEILNHSLDNDMPILGESNGHAWMITGYISSGSSIGKYYINMNEGDANGLTQDVDNIHDTTKKYSYVYTTYNATYGLYDHFSPYTATVGIGFAPNCVKQIKDFLFICAGSISKTYIYNTDTNASTNRSIYSYIRYIRKYETGASTSNNKYKEVITFGKNDKIILYTAGTTPYGNSILERMYMAVCLDNIEANEEPIILKSIWWNPISGNNQTSCVGAGITIYSNDNVSFSNVPQGTYELVMRYSKDDGQTFSEKVILPDIKERETLTVEVTSSTVTITPSYKNYGEE